MFIKLKIVENGIRCKIKIDEFYLCDKLYRGCQIPLSTNEN